MLSSALGAPYEELIRTRLFMPLGMADASFGMAPLVTEDDWARPHTRERNGENYGPWQAVVP